MLDNLRYGCLRALRVSDAKAMLEWMHDPGIASMFQRDFLSMELDDVMSFIEDSHKSVSSLHFAIANDQDEYMGTVSLKNIDPRNSCAEYAICMRLCAQGTGLAANATKDVLRYAFEELKLHRVYLNVRADNARARHFYSKVGFVEEGCSRDAIVLVAGGYIDLIWLSLLAEETAQVFKVPDI